MGASTVFLYIKVNTVVICLDEKARFSASVHMQSQEVFEIAYENVHSWLPIIACTNPILII